MNIVHVYTSFTYAYLSRARVLAASLRRNHPNWVLWAVMVDYPPDGFEAHDWAKEFDHVLDPSILFGDGWKRWIFKHDIVEACTAVKGDALVHILSSGAEKVIYLDPDIAVFHNLSEIESMLDKYSTILTPHQVEPNTDEREIVDNEMTSMKYGIYNLGFLAVRNDEEGRKMATWWATCLRHACYDDVPNGIFTDQKYCDHVPGLFGAVGILRDPGYNVASWNLSQRTISIGRDGIILVNGTFPLRFYHFTKINSEGDVMTERYARDQLSVFEVWNWYKREMQVADLPGIPRRYWYYGHFSDGSAIPKSVRVFFRGRPDLMNMFEDPFDSGDSGFLSWLRLNETNLAAEV